MILFRQTPVGRPFLWQTVSQPEGRWHAAGEGPAHYFADTPDGAWVEFLRHSEIVDVDELKDIKRWVWAIEANIEPVSILEQGLDHKILTGNKKTYGICQKLARQLRNQGITSIVAPSAALRAGEANGWNLNDGLRPASPRDGYVFVVFGALTTAVAWLIGTASPPEYMLDKCRFF
jgi:hypothetical protein